MRYSTRRDSAETNVPFQKKNNLKAGVTVTEQMDYRGSKITVFARNIGITGQRVAYTARVDNPEAAESRYLGYHSKKEALLDKAKGWVDSTVKPVKPKFIKLVTRQNAWQLWFEDEEDAT